MRLDRLLRAVIVVCLLSLAPLAHAQSYGETLSSRWRSILQIQKQDGPYRWFGVPTDNFGVMTTYARPSGKQLTDADRICATWTCIGVESAMIPTDESRFTTVKGFADSRMRSTFELANDKDGRAVTTLLLSNLFRTLAIDGPVSLSKSVKFDLRADEVYRRSLNVPKFQDYLKTASDSPMHNYWESGQLSYIGADIIARGLTLTISVAAVKDPLIHAQLIQAMARLGTDGTGVRVSSHWKDEYLIQFPGFLVLATQLHHEWNPSGAHGGGSPIAERQLLAATETVPRPQLDPLTLHVLPATRGNAAMLDRRLALR
jgi:hypothetical protein